jgi:hypothetical protein
VGFFRKGLLAVGLSPAPSQPLTNPASCLDYSAKSQTLAPGQQKPLVNHRVNLYPSGEIEVNTVTANLQSRPPRPARGKRLSRGVSRRGKKLIRRAVEARVASKRSCAPVVITLTSKEHPSDEEFKRHTESWLAYGRKYAPKAFEDYVLVYDLQQRGVLHAHFLLFQRVPTRAFAKLRNLWAERYGHGAGSVDIDTVKRQAKTASAYLRKVTVYLSSQEGLNATTGRVGRNGKAYVREAFEGNAYTISANLRRGCYASVSVVLPFGDSRVQSLLSVCWKPNEWSGYLRGLNYSQALTYLASMGLGPPGGLGLIA